MPISTIDTAEQPQRDAGKRQKKTRQDGDTEYGLEWQECVRERKRRRKKERERDKEVMLLSLGRKGLPAWLGGDQCMHAKCNHKHDNTTIITMTTEERKKETGNNASELARHSRYAVSSGAN